MWLQIFPFHPFRRYPHGMRSLSDPKTMEQILSQRLSKELKTEPLETQSRFLKPVSAFFRYIKFFKMSHSMILWCFYSGPPISQPATCCSMDGKQKRWDFVESMPSVAVALVDIDLQSLIVVRQFRAPVYHHMCKEVRACWGHPLT